MLPLRNLLLNQGTSIGKKGNYSVQGLSERCVDNKFDRVVAQVPAQY